MIGPILRDPQTQLLSCLDFIVVAVKLSTCKFETFQHLLKKAGNSGPLIPMVTTACWTWVASCHLSDVTFNAPAPSPIEICQSSFIIFLMLLLFSPCLLQFSCSHLSLWPLVFTITSPYPVLFQHHYLSQKMAQNTCHALVALWVSLQLMEKYLIHFIAIIHPTQQHLIMARPVDDKAKKARQVFFCISLEFTFCVLTMIYTFQSAFICKIQ